MPALPAPLRAGSRVALVTPSGPLARSDLPLVDAAVDRLHAEGWEAEIVGATGGRSPIQYLAASDASRNTALRKALRTFDAVVFTRGGYGAARLLDSAGWDHPGPWVMGFSDTTALLWARYGRGLTGSVHGPCAKNLTTHPDWSVDRAIAILSGRPVEPLHLTHLTGPASVVRAPIIAGNLTVATSLLGTPYMPHTDGHVIVFEDVNEPPYKVDRMLTQWRQSGRLQRAAAVVVGTFDSTPDPRTYETVLERSADLGIPVYSSVDIGHHGVCAALPIGAAISIRGRQLYLD